MKKAIVATLLLSSGSVHADVLECALVKSVYQGAGCCANESLEVPHTCDTPTFDDVSLQGSSLDARLRQIETQQRIDSLRSTPLNIELLTTQFQQLDLYSDLQHDTHISIPAVDGIDGPNYNAFKGMSRTVNPKDMNTNDVAKVWLGIAEMMFMVMSAKNGGQFLRSMSPLNTKTDPDFSRYHGQLSAIEGFVAHGEKYASNSMVDESVQIGIGTVMVRMRGMLQLYRSTFTSAHATTNRELGGVTSSKHILDPVGASGYMVNWYDAAIYNTPQYSAWYLDKMPVTARSLRDAFVYGVEQRAYSVKLMADKFETAKLSGESFVAHAYPFGMFSDSMSAFGKQTENGTVLLDDDGVPKYTVMGGLTPTMFAQSFGVKNSRSGTPLGEIHVFSAGYHTNAFDGKTFDEFLELNGFVARYFFNTASIKHLRYTLTADEYDETMQMLRVIYDNVFSPAVHKLAVLKKEAFEDPVYDDYPGLFRLGLAGSIKNIDRDTGEIHYLDGTTQAAAAVADLMKESTASFRSQMCTTHYVDPINGEYFKLVKMGNTDQATTVKEIVAAYSAESFPANIETVDDAIYEGGLSLVSFFNDIRNLLVKQALQDPAFGPTGVTEVGDEFSITDSFAALKDYYDTPLDIDYLGYHYGATGVEYFNPNNIAGNTEKPSDEWIVANEQNADGSPLFKYSLPFGNLARDVLDVDAAGAPVLNENGERQYSVANFNSVSVSNMVDWIKGEKRGTLALYKLNLITDNTRKYIWSDRMKDWGYVETGDDAFIDVLENTYVFLQDTLGSSFSVLARPVSVKDKVDAAVLSGDVTQAQADAFMARMGFDNTSLMVSANPGTQQSTANPNAMQGVLVHEFWVGHALDFAYEVAHPDITDDKPFGTRPAGTGLHKMNAQGYEPSSDDFSSAANVEAYATYGEVLAFDHALHMKIDQEGHVMLDANGNHIPDPIAALSGLNDLSRVGARMVVDVALHSDKYKWSLSEVIRFFYESTGIGGASLGSFMSRFVFNPVQQQAYGGGLIVNVGVQSYLQNALGASFDIAKYIQRRIGPDDQIALGVLVPWYKANTQMFVKD